MNKLADDITRDLLAKPKAKPRWEPCFACGLANRPLRDGRFHDRHCREWFDAGHPHLDPERDRRIADPDITPYTAWKAVAGPPDVKMRTNPWQSIIDASDRIRAERARAQEEGQKESIRPRRFCDQCGAKLPVWVDGKALPNAPSASDASPSRSARSGTMGPAPRRV